MAKKWYSKSAFLGDSFGKLEFAKLVLEHFSEENNQAETSISFLKSLVMENNFEAMMILAKNYEEGRLTNKNLTEAQNLFYKVAENGNIQAQLKVAEFYERKPSDFKKAYYWLSKAKEQNSPEAFRKLGKLTATGFGTKKNIDAKFSPNCGQSVTATAPAQTALNLSAAVKKELIQLSNAYFSMYAVSLLLMKLQVEGGFQNTLSDLGDDVGLVLAFMFVVIGAAVALLYFMVRVQGINRGKPGWVLGTLVVIGAATLWSWTIANFSNFNWADWLSEAIGVGQLYVLFSSYQLLNAAKSARE